MGDPHENLQIPGSPTEKGFSILASQLFLFSSLLPIHRTSMVQATTDDPTHDILLYSFPYLADNTDATSNLKRKLAEPEDGLSLSLPRC